MMQPRTLFSVMMMALVLQSLPAAAWEPLLSGEVQTETERALEALTMTRDDAGFEKDHGKPAWTLAWITNTLADPWALPVQGDRIAAAAEDGSATTLWDLASDLMEVGVTGNALRDEGDAVSPSDGLEAFLADAAEASLLLEQAFSGVTMEERIYLAAAVLAPILETEDDPAAQAALAGAGMPRSVQERVEAEGRLLDGTESALRWLELVRRVDLNLLVRTARIFQQALADVSAMAASKSEWPESPEVRETAWGRIIIGTPGDDMFEGPALLIIDPGGDDSYSNTGAANGLIGPGLAGIIDLAGHDRYRSDGLLGAASSLWGVSVVLDKEGDDVHDALLSGVAATLFGTAWLEDHAGDDRYRCRVLGQAAAEAGFAFLIDREGNDLYEAGLYGQGFAGVMGWGLLIDRNGHDRYFAGNLRPDHERNDDRHLSLSQGFSIGMRPHAGGGVGALVDLAGNDHYSADIYGQGVSYYYSAGFLIDGSGNDRYAMYQYGQGCGIHLSLGLLADGAGHDFYTGYILAQGAAHDYAVGMLFEQGGDDTYTADHHAQGRALNNAFALLVDQEGQDAYFGRQQEGTQGIGNTGGFRDYGSLALLIDLAGMDFYSGGMSNNATTLRPLYGAVHDLEGEVD